MKKNNVKIVIAADYFDEQTVAKLASDVGATAVMLPYYVGGRKEVDTWEKLMDFWITQIHKVAKIAGKN